MNFCNESDKYISLYLDDMLDGKNRIQFEKHLEECSHCAAKLKEASFFVDLCREDQEIQLPVNFSASLHSRLLEISEKDSHTNFSFLLRNKKLFASLSSAAVVVIFILAYNLLPHMSSSKRVDTVQQQAASAESGKYDNIGAENSLQSQSDYYDASGTSSDMLDAAADNDTATAAAKDTATAVAKNTATVQKESISIAPDSKRIRTFNDELSTQDAIKFGIKGSAKEENSSKEERKASSSLSSSENADDLAVAYNISSTYKENIDNYFSNYSEFSLKVSPRRIEIGTLSRFMKEIGATQLKSDIISTTVDKIAQGSSESIPIDSSYIDYYLPLSVYSTLEHRAAKYMLELRTKTDIITNDITARYNVLNTQKIEIDKNIVEALNNGMRSSDFETEKIKLIDEMNKIISEKQMITIRIFFVQ